MRGLQAQMETVTSARAWTERTLGREVPQQKTRLTYSNATGIIEEGPAPAALVVCIIQVTSRRIPRAMDLYRFVLGIVLGLYIGFPRLNQLRFIARDPILTGILKVAKLPVQSTFWRFINALHLNVAR